MIETNTRSSRGNQLRLIPGFAGPSGPSGQNGPSGQRSAADRTRSSARRASQHRRARLDYPSRDWELDDYTRAVGREGIAQIRETLRRHRPIEASPEAVA